MREARLQKHQLIPQEEKTTSSRREKDTVRKERTKRNEARDMPFPGLFIQKKVKSSRGMELGFI